MKKKILTVPIPVRLSVKMLQEIDQIAEKNYKTRSTLIREWIEKGIKNEKN